MNDFKAVRFERASRRQLKDALRLSDFVRSMMTRKKDGVTKDALPAWSLCNDTGTDGGKENGLLQLDFDHAEDPEGIKRLLAAYPGVLLAAVSASGKGVFALIYAPDHNAGVYAARHIAAYLRSHGLKFDLDESVFKPCQLRFEPYDPKPIISERLAAIAPDYDSALTRSGAKDAFEIWTNGSRCQGDDYEAAVTAIFCAALCSKVQSRYGLNDKPFRGGCDVQIIGESGGAKTYGRIKPLRNVAKVHGVRLAGGLRATDAAAYDDFIEAACVITTDEKGRAIEITLKPEPDKIAYIVDESGDTETSRAGNSTKAQQNLIRRIACFDGEINAGYTAQQRKLYNGLLPAVLPVRLVQYRATTPNQLRNVDFADQQAGGNGRRTLYASQKPVQKTFLASDDLRQKSARILTHDAEQRLDNLTQAIAHLYGCGDYVTFDADADATGTARQAAKIAFERAKIPEEYADTILYNTALYVACLRCALDYMTARDSTFDGRAAIPAPIITGNDLETATAIALNSFRVVSYLTAQSAADRLADARTDTEKTRLILDYIAGKKSGDVARGNLARYFGRDVLAAVDAMCAEGVLTETIKVNTEGKNPNAYYSITPDGEQAAAAAVYAAKKTARAPRTRPRDCGSVWDGTAHGTRYDQASVEDKEARVLNYIKQFEADHPLNVKGSRNKNFNMLIFGLHKAGMWDAVAQDIVRARATAAGLPDAEIRKLMRRRRV